MPAGGGELPTPSAEQATVAYRALAAPSPKLRHEGLLDGDGGFGPALAGRRGRAVELILQRVTERAGYRRPGRGAALDVAATQFHRDGRYRCARTAR